MARDVNSVHEFTHDPPYGLEKEKTVVRCDDGTVYEFEQSDSLPKDAPPRLVRAFQPNGRMTHVDGQKVLPDAVEETVETLLGGWSK
jgi:hypothetical protein